MARRLVYWLSEEASEAHHYRVGLLDKRGYTVRMFNNARDMFAEISRRRPYIVIIGDEGPPSEVQRTVQKISSSPDIQGARLILSTTRPDATTSYMAACSSFRDIIPLHLDPRSWLSRFLFATASKSIPIKQPVPRLVVNEISALSLPARIVWVGQNLVQLESRIKPPLGAILSLAGPFANALNVKNVSLKVTETRNTHLTYRFSDALTAQWSVPKDKHDAAQQLIAELKKGDYGPRYKAFVAVQSSEYRSLLLKHLSKSRFDVTTALQKSSIVNEPIYISPDLIFIEDSLCREDDYQRFRLMLQSIDIDTPVVVVGKKVSLPEIQQIDPIRRFHHIETISSDLTNQALTSFLNPVRGGSRPLQVRDSAFIRSDNPLSLGEINLPARLTHLHPTAISIATPYPIGNFALARLESPLIKKAVGASPYVKFFECHTTTPQVTIDSFSYEHGGYIADTTLKQSTAIANLIGKLVEEKIIQQFITRQPNLTTTEPVQPKPLYNKNLLNLATPSTPGKPSQGLATTQHLRGSVNVANIPNLEPYRTAEQVATAQISHEHHSGKAPNHQSLDHNPVDPLNNDGSFHQEATARKINENKSYQPEGDHAPLLRELKTAMAETSADVMDAFKRTLLDRSFLYFLTFVALIAFFASAVWFGAQYASEDWGKNQGRVFTDSLRKYAPSAFEKEQNK